MQTVVITHLNYYLYMLTWGIFKHYTVTATVNSRHMHNNTFAEE